MQLRHLAATKNLDLAWRRITTGANHQYKRLYRDLYYAYEIALPANLRTLRQRLLGGTFEPTRPERIYVPKQSGLHRPLSLLPIEDQVVLQAFANLAANRLQSKRKPLQFRVVYSNILQEPDSIFFFRRWQDTYKAFQRQVRSKFSAGLHWVGDFDLAAFYETISHELLLRTIHPRARGDGAAFIERCLSTWSSEHLSSGHAHGLPQGPLASDLLAECFLLPIDLALKDVRGYVRYVDDVRLFGASEAEVREELIALERECRERGLIPQVGKFAIKRAHRAEDAMGMLPSMADPHHEDDGGSLDVSEASTAFRSAIGGRPLQVEDKTRVRYVLFRAGPYPQLLKPVLRLVPRHPEHADAFFTFLRRFPYRVPIERLCVELVEHSPYQFVRGEAWHVLASYLASRESLNIGDVNQLRDRAVNIATTKPREGFAELFGSCHYLCVLESLSGDKHSRLLLKQSILLQAFVGGFLPSTALAKSGAGSKFLLSPAPEPGLGIMARLQERQLTPSALGVDIQRLAPHVANTLRELGLVVAPEGKFDPIAVILKRRYRVEIGAKSWRPLLGSEYVHALGLLKFAEAAFDAGRSVWLQHQNSFNHAVFLAIQRQLLSIGHSGACKTTNKKGGAIDFGVMLDPNGPFGRYCPEIAQCFRSMNQRRNRLPGAHPYDKKTGAQSRHLGTQERNAFVGRLRAAYTELVSLMP